MRLLLTGASGYLGAHLAPFLARRFDLLSLYFSNPAGVTAGNPFRLDLKDEAATARLLEDLRPDVILHTAASNRDQQNQDAILPAARALASFAGRTGARLIHFSTDLVFDGEQPPYYDDTPPCPIMVYGKVKAEAEAVVREVCPAATIVRPSLIFGLYPIDKQTEWLVEGVKRGETVRLFTDEVRCPIWVSALAEATIELIDLDCPGPIHVVGSQPLTRWEFGQKLLCALGLPSDGNVIPSTIAESGLVRPKNLTLAIERARRLLKTHLPTVDEALVMPVLQFTSSSTSSYPRRADSRSAGAQR